MTTTYPLSTLGPTVTSAGITIPQYSDIYASLQASFQAIYGSDAYISADSQDGQLLAVFAKAISDVNQQMVALYQSFSPSYAQGVELSSLVRINGLTRDVATNSTAPLLIGGTAGTVITNGVAQDTNGNLWNLPASVTIPTSGSIAVTGTAQEAGAIVALSGTISKIYNPQLGWTSVTSTAAATLGAPVETDAALRVRQAASVALPASSPLGSIYAAIGQLSGVTNWTVYENNTAVTDANGVPSHSIDVIVAGGSLTEIAQTIQQTKSPGTGTYGGTSETVTDATSGLPITINFDVLAQTQVYVSLTIVPLANYVSTTAAAIQAAISAFINSLPIGGAVYYSQVYAAAQLQDAGVGTTYYISSLTLGTTASPTGTANLTIAFNAIANCPTANVVVTA
jgi:uncharacterized phage protein gp47/JayE